MVRKVVAASLVLVLCVGVVLADEFRALITKVEGNKVTFSKIEGKGKDIKKGEEETMTVSKDAKIVKGKFNKETKAFEAGDELEGGLKNKMFKDIPEKGIFAQINAEDKKITEIRVFRFGGKGKKKQ